MHFSFGKTRSRKVVVGSVVALAFTLAAVGLGVGLTFGGVLPSKAKGGSSTFPLTTSTPSAMPSPSPSFSPAPTLRPSWRPSSTPTHAPSSGPTPSPTEKPTISPAPTSFPTALPTASPTAEPLPDGYTFRMKMYWRQGFFWQEETIERKWCLECVTCSPLTTDTCGGKSNGNQCKHGDQLWMKECEDNGDNAVFEIAKRDNQRGDLFQVHNTNLCMARKDARFIVLDTCNRNDPSQRFLGFQPNGTPFTWEPLVDEGLDRAISQHHHPKEGEVIYSEDYYLAHYWDTGFWQAI